MPSPVASKLIDRMKAPKLSQTDQTINVRISKDCIPILQDIRNREMVEDNGKRPTYGEIATMLIKAAYEHLREAVAQDDRQQAEQKKLAK